MASKRSRNAHKAKIIETAKHIDILEKKNKSMSEEISIINSESLMLKILLEKYEPTI